MNWWQIGLAIWGIGAFAAFPSLYEFNDSAVDGLNAPPWWAIVLLTVAGVLRWPAAWLSLIAYAGRHAVGRP